MYNFVLKEKNGRALRIEVRRVDEDLNNVYNIFLDYQESVNTKITLSIVVAGVGNNANVRRSLLLKDEDDDAAATEEIHQKGGVMIQRVAKHNEKATNEDNRRTRGLTMRILGTLLLFLEHIGMCNPKTRVYVYPGEIVTDSKPKVDKFGIQKGLKSLVEYYRQSTFEHFKGLKIMVTTVGQLAKRCSPMTFSPFEPDDIILSDRIFGGASHDPVWNGSLRGNPVIYKLMKKHEYNILMKVQGIGVVRVLYKTENYKLPEEIDRLGTLVAMEKLDTIKLHPDYNTGEALDTKYSLENRVKKGVLLNMHSFDFNNLRRLLNTIVEINNMGILWGDLKQENIGVDKDGNLRIFDFSESRTISRDLENKHLEILAYGKLLYNIITQNFAFHPGRHYRGGRDLTRDEFLQVIDMIQDIDSISKNALQKCFLLNNESTDNDISESIKELYLMLDFNQNKFK